MEDRDTLNSKISFSVIPSLRDIGRKVGALTILAWCQLMVMVLVVGLLALVLARVL